MTNLAFAASRTNNKYCKGEGAHRSKSGNPMLHKFDNQQKPTSETLWVLSCDPHKISGILFNAVPWSDLLTVKQRVQKKNRKEPVGWFSVSKYARNQWDDCRRFLDNYLWEEHVLMGDSAAPNHGWGPLHVIQAIVRWGTPFNRIPSHMFRMFIFFETRDSEHKCWARESLINHKSKSQIIPQVFPLACNQLHG